MKTIEKPARDLQSPPEVTNRNTEPKSDAQPISMLPVVSCVHTSAESAADMTRTVVYERLPWESAERLK